MAFSFVDFAYKMVVPASKLTQLMSNIVSHDHRPDGSQGAPFPAIPTVPYLNAGMVTVPCAGGAGAVRVGVWPGGGRVFLQTVATVQWDADPSAIDGGGFNVNVFHRAGANVSASVNVFWFVL